jgi:putative adhesin
MRHAAPLVSLFFVPLLALSTAAGAATPIDQTRALDARGRIDIENIKGRIQVRAWERNEVKISGTLGEGVEKLVVEGDAEHLVVKVQYPNHGGWGGNKSGPTDLQLMVPVRADLDIDAVSADVDVSGVASSRLSIENVSGSVMVAAAPTEVDVESVSGDLRLTVNSGDVQAQTVSGGIILRGRMNGEVSTETVSGDIDVAVNGERVRELSSSTVSGSAEVRAALAPKGEIRMESVSGSLKLTLPKGLSAQVSGESFSGNLKAPGARIERPEHGPGASFNTRYGAGDGEIHLETFSGNAELRLE